MAKVWIFNFARQVGRAQSDCPPSARGEFGERLAQSLWTLERKEQRRWRGEARRQLRDSADTLH